MKWFDIPDVAELLDEYLELQRKGESVKGGQRALSDRISQIANEKISRSTVQGKLEMLKKKLLQEKYENSFANPGSSPGGRPSGYYYPSSIFDSAQTSSSVTSPRKLYVLTNRPSHLSQPPTGFVNTPKGVKSRLQSQLISVEPSKFKAAHPKAAQIGAKLCRPKPRAGTKKKIVGVVKRVRPSSPLRIRSHPVKRHENVGDDGEVNETVDSELVIEEQDALEAAALSEAPPQKVPKFSGLERCTSPVPDFTVGVRPRNSDRMVVLYEGQDKNYWFTPHVVRKCDGALSYSCIGCARARYLPRVYARYKRRIGSEEGLPEINNGDRKYIWLAGDKIVEKRGRHHKDCQPMSNQEIALLRVKRAEREFLNYVKETAGELNVAPQELRKTLRTFPLRRWPLDGKQKKQEPRNWRKIKREREMARARQQAEVLGYTIEDPQEVTLELDGGARYRYVTVDS